jgi:hypothetical protein
MNSRRLLGLAILALAIVGAVLFSFWQSGTLGVDALGQQRNLEPLVLRGYVSGDKIGLLQDPDVQRILANRYRITLEYSKVGSMEMVRRQSPEVDFLWPASQAALESYRAQGSPLAQSDTIFNSPFVFYSWDVVVDALEREGLVQQVDGVYYVTDLARLVDMIVAERNWSDIGVNHVYGKMRIVTADPSRSGSGSQFAVLLATTLNRGELLDEAALNAVMSTVNRVFASQGLLPGSGSDLFAQYLRQGAGSHPIIASYESHLVEYSLENRRSLAMIQERTRILYPQPTMWSGHPLIAVNDQAKRLSEALLDPDIQQLAQTKHGFRTGIAGVLDDPRVLEVAAIPETIDMVTPMPRASVVERLTAALEQ